MSYLNKAETGGQITCWNFDSWATAGAFFGGCEARKEKQVESKVLALFFTHFCILEKNRGPKRMLTSGAALLGFRPAVCGLVGAENSGLQAWVADDPKNVGWLICADPRWGLRRSLLDRNNGLNCPEEDGRYLRRNTRQF